MLVITSPRLVLASTVTKAGVAAVFAVEGLVVITAPIHVVLCFLCFDLRGVFRGFISTVIGFGCWDGNVEERRQEEYKVKICSVRFRLKVG